MNTKETKKNYRTGFLCPKCKVLVISINHHDFIECDCGTIHVDGGGDYIKFGWDTNIVKTSPKTFRVKIQVEE